MLACADTLTCYPVSYADVLAQSLPEMQDGGSNSAALRAANAPSASLLSADGGEDRVRLPGPAITVEPSAEAVAAVQALFARQPQLMADAGAAAEFDVFSPAGGVLLLRAASRVPQQSDARMRTGGAAPKRARREGGGAGGEALVLAAAPPPSAAAEPAPAAALCAEAAHPSTPQQAIPRRTSAPY